MICYSNTWVMLLVPPLHCSKCHPCSHQSWTEKIPISMLKTHSYSSKIHMNNISSLKIYIHRISLNSVLSKYPRQFIQIICTQSVLYRNKKNDGLSWLVFFPTNNELQNVTIPTNQAFHDLSHSLTTFQSMSKGKQLKQVWKKLKQMWKSYVMTQFSYSKLSAYHPITKFGTSKASANFTFPSTSIYETMNPQYELRFNHLSITYWTKFYPCKDWSIFTQPC